MPSAFDEGFEKAKLPLMARRRLPVLFLAVTAACGTRDQPPQSDSMPRAPSDSAPSVAVTGDWPPELGDVLVAPSDTDNLAVVLYPAAPVVVINPAAQLAFLGSGGDTAGAPVRTSGLDSARCGDAPLLRLARPPAAGWSIGLAGGTAQPVRGDSLEALSHADSLLYGTEAPRLASIVAARSPSRLTGLPFELAGLRRVRLGDTTVIAVQLVRRINQEANPAEERTFVIAAQYGSSPFEAVYSDRSEGTEESATHYDLLGAFRGKTSVYLVVSSDGASGSTIGILERNGGVWRMRWTRSIAC